MARAATNSIQNAKGKYWTCEGNFSTAKNAEVLSRRAASEIIATDNTDFTGLKIVPAPAEAVAREAKARAKADALKARETAARAKEKAKNKKAKQLA